MLTPTPSSFVAADYITRSNFQGWYLQVTPEPMVCEATQTFYTSGPFGGCGDPTVDLPLPTACDGSTLIRGSAAYNCQSYSCSSYTVFETEHAPLSDGTTVFSCLTKWGANTIYKSLPAQYISSTAAPEKSQLPSPKPAKPATVTQTSQPTSANAASSNDSGSSGLSGGAIAGIVIGCVVGVALLALFLFRKRLLAYFGRGNGPVNDSGPTWSPVYMPPQTQSHSTSNWQASEMSEQNAIYEIGSSRNLNRPHVVHEMS